MTATQIESGTWPDNVGAKALFSGRPSPVFVDFSPSTTFLGVLARHAVSLAVAHCANMSQAVHFHFGSHI